MDEALSWCERPIRSPSYKILLLRCDILLLVLHDSLNVRSMDEDIPNLLCNIPHLFRVSICIGTPRAVKCETLKVIISTIKLGLRLLWGPHIVPIDTL